VVNTVSCDEVATQAKPRRAYRSRARAEQAERTRQRILDAARELFLAQGFAATTIAAVAERAELAPETVYATYRSKAGLLGGVVRAVVTRGDEPDDPLERRWTKELLELPDLEARLAAFARHTAATLELTSPMYAVIRSAGTGAQELSGLDAELREMRYGQQAKVMRAVVDGGTLAPGVSVMGAAETFSALASPELYHLLTEGRGWSPRRYSRWLEGIVKSVLLPG
jgi:AcrR family transcriptional regulator